MSVLMTPAARAGSTRVLTPSQTVIRCGRCGGSRPVGHAHCYACGARLTGRTEKKGSPGGRMRAPSWSGVRDWVGAAKSGVAGRLFSRRARPAAVAVGYGGRPVQVRTFGDRAARMYVAISMVGVAAWFVAGPGGGLPVQASGALGIGAGSAALASGPSEACAWVDGQRVQLMGEAGRVVEAQRGELARRLGELALLVRAGR